MPAYSTSPRPSIQQEKHYRFRTIDRQELVALLDQGRTQAQIAEALGVSEQTIWRRAREWDLRTARTGPRSAADHPAWTGGRSLDKHGYVTVYCPLHPQARKPRGVVAEHRLVMEVMLGRYLLPEEVVDHRDSWPYHNWPSNLRLFASNADHLRCELTGRGWSTSPRRAIPGAYGCSQKIARCPDTLETLALAPSETVLALAWYIDSHRPTSAHQSASRRSILRSGAWRDPFRLASTA